MELALELVCGMYAYIIDQRLAMLKVEKHIKLEALGQCIPPPWYVGDKHVPLASAVCCSMLQSFGQYHIILLLTEDILISVLMTTFQLHLS